MSSMDMEHGHQIGGSRDRRRSLVGARPEPPRQAYPVRGGAARRSAVKSGAGRKESAAKVRTAPVESGAPRPAATLTAGAGPAPISEHDRAAAASVAVEAFIRQQRQQFRSVPLERPIRDFFGRALRAGQAALADSRFVQTIRPAPNRFGPEAKRLPQIHGATITSILKGVGEYARQRWPIDVFAAQVLQRGREDVCEAGGVGGRHADGSCFTVAN
jgi:hypothetical protein